MSNLKSNGFHEQSKEIQGGNLLVLNYALDRVHPVLSHQFDVVEGLSSRFKKVTVLTGSYDGTISKENIFIECTNWRAGKNFYNAYQMFRGLVRILRQDNIDVVFSHMTLVHSALFGPIFRLKSIPHFLWYAHAQDSILLRWARLICNGIITSTKGSCPISGKKVHAIGQGIRTDVFLGNQDISKSLKNCVHIGRTDRSKNIDLIIQSVANARNIYPNLTLEIVGSPTNPKNAQYLDSVKDTYSEYVQLGWLKFSEAVSRADVPMKLSEKDIFIHAFIGSLDKALIEATMAGLSVVTLNPEYINEFPESGLKHDVPLSQLLLNLLRLDYEERKFINYALQAQAMRNHSFDAWINNIFKILRLK